MTNSNWRQQCKAIGLDPQEVKSVAKRFAMYKTYTDAQGGNTLELPDWYKWYRVEKLSEGHANLTPPGQGCSIESSTDNPEARSTIVGETEFLALLEAYRATLR
jgi:hypothetical protein